MKVLAGGDKNRPRPEPSALSTVAQERHVTTGKESSAARCASSRRLRLLLLTAGEASGPHDRAHAIVHWLARRGHAVSVIGAAGRRGQPARPLQMPGVGPIGWRVRHVSFALAAAPALLGEAASFAPDLVGVLAHSAAAASAALAAARIARVPAWLHLEEEAPPLGVEAAFECVSAATPDAPSRLERRGVSSAAGLPLPPWVDLRADPGDAARMVVRQSLGAGPGDVVALYAGWCGDERVARTVIDASRLVPPRGAIRFAAATEGPAARLFAAAAAELPRLVALRLPAPGALASLLVAADLHLMPEGPAAIDPLIPAKLASLLASGRPVLAGPPRDRFVSTFEPVAGARLAEAVVALAAASDECRKRGLAARQAAEDYFAMERVLRRLEQRLVALAGS